MDHEDRDRALAIRSAFQEHHPDQRFTRIRRKCDYLFFCVAGAATFGLPPLFFTKSPLLGVFVAVDMIVSGALIGHLIDRLRLSYRKSGHIRFGILDFLLLTAIFATLLSLRHLASLLG